MAKKGQKSGFFDFFAPNQGGISGNRENGHFQEGKFNTIFSGQPKIGVIFGGFWPFLRFLIILINFTPFLIIFDQFYPYFPIQQTENLITIAFFAPRYISY